jgi:hypothetical protein
MANTAVTPLSPAGGRVRAWCVTKVFYKLNASDPNPTTQAIFDSVNFVDGYNLRMDFASITTPDTFIPYKFSFVTPMQSKNYRVFCQIMCNTNENVYATETSPQQWFAYSPYKSMFVYDVPRFPKTTSGFWIGTPYLNAASTDSYITTIYNALQSEKSKAFTLAVAVL